MPFSVNTINKFKNIVVSSNITLAGKQVWHDDIYGVSATELGYISNLSSDAQTQITTNAYSIGFVSGLLDDFAVDPDTHVDFSPANWIFRMGLGTMATQNADAVAITGGSIVVNDITAGNGITSDSITASNAITAWDITAGNVITANVITATDITAWDITSDNVITAWDITAGNVITATNITASNNVLTPYLSLLDTDQNNQLVITYQDDDTAGRNLGLKVNGGSRLLTIAGDATISGTNTGDQTTITGNAGTATTLQTGRTIGITGDLTYTSPTFNGSANVTAAGTLATVNSNVGSFGSATASPVITLDAKGRATSASSTTITPAVGSITGLGTGVATALAATPTGTGGVVLAAGPTLTGNILMSRAVNIPNPTSLILQNTTAGASGIQLGNSTLASNNYWQFFITNGGSPQFKIGQDNIGDYLTISIGGAAVFASTLSASSVTSTTAGASTSTPGTVELATDAETATGTDTARAITPANLEYKLDNSPTITAPILTGTISLDVLLNTSIASNGTDVFFSTDSGRSCWFNPSWGLILDKPLIPTSASLTSIGTSALPFNGTFTDVVSITSGSNKKAGTFTLTAGAATVSNTSITANSVVMLTLKTVGGTRAGNPDIVCTASTGFVATAVGTDTSTYNYVILEVN